VCIDVSWVAVEAGRRAFQSSTFANSEYSQHSFEANLATDGDYTTAACTSNSAIEKWLAIDIDRQSRVRAVNVTNYNYDNFRQFLIYNKYVLTRIETDNIQRRTELKAKAYLYLTRRQHFLTLSKLRYLHF
jgi:hypothetical protein